LPAGGAEHQDVVHEPGVKQPYSFHPIIQLLKEERTDEPYTGFKMSLLLLKYLIKKIRKTFIS
jgi:hypothetical protein